MLPFVYLPIAAAFEQRSGNDGHSSQSHNNFRGAQNNTMPQNQAGGMSLGDLEAGHGQVPYPHCAPPPSYTGTPLPSTPPPSYHGVPLPSAPAPNTLSPHANHQIPTTPVRRPSPPRRSPRRTRCGPPSCGGLAKDKNCQFMLFSLACAIIVVLFLMIGCYYGKDGIKDQESQIHCRGVVVTAAAAAGAAAGTAHGGCG